MCHDLVLSQHTSVILQIKLSGAFILRYNGLYSQSVSNMVHFWIHYRILKKGE